MPVPPNQKPLKSAAPITDTVINFKALLSNPDKIVLAWSDHPNAAYYKIKWDKGDPVLKNNLIDLEDTPSSEIYVTSRNAGSVMGSPEIRKNGGTFNF